MSYTQHHYADAVQSLAESVCGNLEDATTLAAQLQLVIDSFVSERRDERRSEVAQ